MRIIAATAILATSMVSPARAQLPPTVPTGPKSGQDYDPYGRWEHPKEVVDGEIQTSRLLRVEDGTPLYEEVKTTNTPPPTVVSRLVPIIKGSDLAFGAGPKSPFLPGTNLRFAYHYLIDFWRTYPQAKVRGKPGDSEVAPGVVAQRLSRASVSAQGVPPAAIDTLFAQAEAAYVAFLQMPALQRAQGIMIRPHVRMYRRTDEAGVQVYGFDLRISAPDLHIDDPKAVKGPDGRWTTPTYGHAAGVTITSNAPLRGGPAWGRYKGTQVAHLNGFAAMVVSGTRPTHISEFRGGGGKQIENPRFFDPARPKTDIQILIVEPSGRNPIDARFANQGSLSPDSAFGRFIAASFLPDWRAVVDKVNSPGAPRAQ